VSRITLGRFFPGDSSLHRLDPRAKILGLACLLTALTVSSRLPVILGCGTALVVLCLGARLPLRLLLGNLGPLLPVLLVTTAIHAFATPGRPLLVLPGPEWVASVEGLAQGARLAFRLVDVLLVVAILTMTTSPLDLADGLERLFAFLAPLKVPVHEVAMTLTIALRFVPMLTDEAARVHAAQASRGAAFGGGPVRRARSLVPLILPLFVSTFARADRLAMAMEARGYSGGGGRSRYRRLRFAAGDWAAVFASFALSVVTVLLG
jgi:energy-coupling factor transport system permease protein